MDLGRHRLRFGFLAAALTVALAVVAVAPGQPAARADTPVFLGWPGLLPPLPAWYSPLQAQDCANGATDCVDGTIADMQAQFDGLAASCNHRAVFSLAYLRTTQEYQRAAAEPGFFQDTSYVNTEDAVFAAYYFQAYQDWSGGNRQNVPAAWQIAFGAADNRMVSGLGDLLLGMNAHVNRDLPFVLASLGLVRPDGTSRKADHDQVNVFLNEVVSPLLTEEAARFDPLIDDLNSPEGITWTALMQLLEGWREAAWRNAELLLDAPTPAARNLVANTIETTAATEAQTLKLAYSNLPPLITAAARDRYCSTHHG